MISCQSSNSKGESPGVSVTETLPFFTQTTTCFDRSKSLSSSKIHLSPTASSEHLIRLDTKDVFQEIDGFGAALTGSSCYNLMKMTSTDRKAFLKKTFSVSDGFGMSYIRISIGCSDFSLSEYTCCDTPGIENFTLTTEERDYVIPVLKDILSINPEIKIMGSPWTCPRWMKVRDLHSSEPYNSWTSGQLNPKYYPDYAEYFVRWILAFREEGIPIYSITVQNEPLNRGNSASMYMGWEEQRNLIRDALGPAFSKSGITTKIYTYDHNYNYSNDDSQTRYPLKIYQDSEAASYVAGAAYHNYGGNKSELSGIFALAPGKELIFTETSIGEWNNGRDLSTRLPADMREVGLGTVNNGCRGVIVWNLLLDSEKGPNRPGGCRTCYGAVDIDKTNYKSLSYNSHYFVLAHLSLAARPGARRIQRKGTLPSGITLGTFVNPDKSPGIVVLNENSESRRLSLTCDDTGYANCEIPPKSVVTIRW